MKRQIDLMQQKLQELQAATQETKKEADTAVATTATPKPHVVESSTHKLGIESADGQYSVNVTGRIHADVGGYPGFDPKSNVVGPQDLNAGFNLRRARIGVVGKVAGDWTYGFIYDAGNSTDNTPAGIQTAQVGYTGFKNTVLELGYSDTFFSLNEATSSNDILFMERATPQVVATGMNTGDFRSNAGGRYFDDRLWVGAYVTGPKNGDVHNQGETLGSYQRVAYQVLQDPAYTLHLGVGMDEIIRAAPAAAGGTNSVALSSAPELRIDSTALLNTGALGVVYNGIEYKVNGGYIANVEAAGTFGPIYAQGEYFHFNIDRPVLKTAEFDGEYGEVSYSLTGETRKYNKAAGAYTALIPDHPFSLEDGGWGAWEIAARVDYTDLTSNFTSGLPISATSQPSAVNGGKETGFTAGLNWYPNTYMRFMLNYIHTDFDKANASTVKVSGVGTTLIGAPVGTTIDAVALRAQVVW